MSIKGQKLLRGALLGCGHIAPYHMKAWSCFPGVKITALANRTLSKAQALAERFDIPLSHTYSDYRELLAAEELDFVDIATAPHIHKEQVIASAERGLNVLCQKPFAPSLEDARQMIEACDRSGVLFSINENWRWRVWYQRIKQLLEQGLVGHPKYIRIAHHEGFLLPRNDEERSRIFTQQPYMADLKQLILYEMGIHYIDILRFLLGRIDSVYARMNRVSSLTKGEDRALIVAAMGEVSGLIDISWASVVPEDYSGILESLVLEGDEGTIELLQDREASMRITTLQEQWREPAFEGTEEQAFQQSFSLAQAHFIECLRQGRKSQTEARDNYQTLRCTFAAYESAAKNRVIVLGEDYGL